MRLPEEKHTKGKIVTEQRKIQLMESAFSALDYKYKSGKGHKTNKVDRSIPIAMIVDGASSLEGTNTTYDASLVEEILDNKLNMGIMGDNSLPGAYTFHLFKEVTYKETGRACRQYPHLIKHDIMVKDRSCTYFHGSYDRYSWAYASHPDLMAPADVISMNMFISLASEAQFALENQDHITIRKKGVNPIVIETTAEATKSFLKLRDIPEGKRRRSMLINWICEHWRRAPRDKAKKTVNVSKHLRGTETCTWMGYEVTITKNT